MSGQLHSAGLNPRAQQAVSNVLGALSGVVGMEIIELWVNTAERFSLHHVYKGETATNDHQTSDPTYARFLAKKALSSKELFYWGSNRTDRLHPSSPYHTAIAFRFPRDNIGTDLYLLGYSSDYIKFAQSKLDFIYWIGHAVSVAAFSVTLYSKTGEENDTSANGQSTDRLRELALDLSQFGSSQLSTKSSHTIPPISPKGDVAPSRTSYGRGGHGSQGNLSIPVTSTRVLTLSTKGSPEHATFAFHKTTSEKSSTCRTNVSSDELSSSARFDDRTYNEEEIEKNFVVDGSIHYSSSSTDNSDDDDDDTLHYPDDVNVVGVGSKFSTYKSHSPSLSRNEKGSSQKSYSDVSPLISSRSDIGK